VNQDTECASCQNLTLFPMAPENNEKDEVCCGPSPGPRSSELERPGYKLWHFVEEMIDTPAGSVPRVKSNLEKDDTFGSVKVRLGGQREKYSVAPGLYAAGSPDQDSPVLVSANYKLSFDSLRKELFSIDAWILVIDTRGINVWCSAGKGTFSAQEIILQVKRASLDKVVNHKELVLPQLGASGVSAAEVKKGCGFKVIWGPVYTKDLREFFASDMKTTVNMRKVTFGLLQRLVLIPVEIVGFKKIAMWTLLAGFVLSGIGSSFFSFTAAWNRGLIVFMALILGILSGAAITPALLPWIPVRNFSLKGTIIGGITGFGFVFFLWGSINVLESAALFLFIIATSSFLAMNFTGSTPFTSPSGVEKEMRKAIPLQALGAIVTIMCWVGAGF